MDLKSRPKTSKTKETKNTKNSKNIIFKALTKEFEN